MTSALISVHPDAKIGENVRIDPFSVIHENTVIGDNTWIGSNVTIFPGARIGKNCRIFPGAVISAIPQDLKFAGEDTTAEIGDNTTIREFVTINRGTQALGKTSVGKNNLLMAYVHVAHDCLIGNHCILANGVTLAGHIEIEDFAILEGLVAVQQFIRIGMHSFVAGGSLVRKNIPPYVKAAHEPLSYVGINAVGLRRRKFSDETINEIQNIYRIIFVKGYNNTNALQMVEAEIPPSAVRDTILSFIRNSPSGIMKGYSGIEED
ncbi:MAG: acyl-ACP--UDP-N-acetylglucosamine O-acyltransferase [Bacteroidetes bacterium]|nr:acyl-ACP--UDP-N-acetylglucosamine O-acyltransferase [Bacteroidota bacterium]